MDVTPWMKWFLGRLDRAIDGAQVTLSAVLDKARFWERVRPRNTPLSPSALRIRRIATLWRLSITAS